MTSFGTSVCPVGTGQQNGGITVLSIHLPTQFWAWSAIGHDVFWNFKWDSEVKTAKLHNIKAPCRYHSREPCQECMEVSQIPPEGMTGVRNKTPAPYVHALPVIRYPAEIVSWSQLRMDATHIRTYNCTVYWGLLPEHPAIWDPTSNEKREGDDSGVSWSRAKRGRHIQHQEDRILPYFFGSWHPAVWFWPINLAEKPPNVCVYWHRIQSSSSKTRHFQCCNISAAYSLKPELVLEYFRDVSLISES